MLNKVERFEQIFENKSGGVENNHNRMVLLSWLLGRTCGIYTYATPAQATELESARDQTTVV